MAEKETPSKKSAEASVTKTDMVNYIGPIFEELKNDIRTMTGRMGGLDQKLSGFDQKLTGFDQKLTGFDQKLSGFDQKLSGFDQKLTGFDQKLTGFDQKLTGFDQKLQSIPRQILHEMKILLERDDRLNAISDFGKTGEMNNEKIENLDGRVTHLEKDVQVLKISKAP